MPIVMKVDAMRLTKAQREENHGRILHTAAKLFRERGVDGVGIDEIMETAGLTHGAFYGHFPSKAALAAKAGEQALKEGRPLLFEEGGRPRETLSEMADFYLSAAHRDNPGIGCAVASLAADMGRQPLEARAGFADGLNITLDRLAAALLGDPDGKREEAIVSFCCYGRCADDGPRHGGNASV